MILTSYSLREYKHKFITITAIHFHPKVMKDHIKNFLNTLYMNMLLVFHLK